MTFNDLPAEGNALAETTWQVFEKYEADCNYKNNEIGWPQLEAIKPLEKDNEKLKLTNESLKVKSQSQRSP